MFVALGANAAPRFDCQRLQALPDLFKLAGNEINAEGEIVGHADRLPDSFSPTPVRWTKDGAMVRMARTDRDSVAFGINDAGDIVGWRHSKQACCTGNASLWKDGRATNLGALAGPQEDASAAAINNSGQIVGTSKTLTGARHATLWEGDQITDLGSLAGPAASSAYAINQAGVIVGASKTSDDTTHAVVWHGGVITDLGTLPGGQNSLAAAVNRQGTIVGISEFAGGQTDQNRAVAWKDGAIRDLGTLPGHITSWASGINRAGTVVGASQSELFLQVAVAWFGLGHAPVDLNALVAPAGCVDDAGLPSTLISATAVNDKGVIVASGRRVDSHGTVLLRPFKLVPR
jgi:probable HAF family extracellular repeat protein